MEKTLSKLYNREVKKMRKSLIVMFVALLSLVLVYGYADAQVAGQCSDCHTMHNSQDGTYMSKDFGGVGTSASNKNLTVSTCLGCHNGVAGGAPNIFGAARATQTAGGSFKDTVFDADNKGHNVIDLSAAYPSASAGAGTTEGTITSTPGGSGSDLTVGPTELTCAGTKGCHGDNTVAGSDEAIAGYHHAAAPGYRFLETALGTNIEGKGDDNWEYASSSVTDHNVYSANADVSISALCAKCHKVFHAETLDGSIWIRHPTENAVADLGSTGSVTVDTENNPFAFAGADYISVTTDSATDYTAAKGKVACISCHRAHATDQPDLLRFDYGDMDAGSATADWGCLGCHVGQR
jgi:nitrate/TMAO reductase-like tetraheme cytochrome c subunit